MEATLDFVSINPNHNKLYHHISRKYMDKAGNYDSSKIESFHSDLKLAQRNIEYYNDRLVSGTFRIPLVILEGNILRYFNQRTHPFFIGSDGFEYVILEDNQRLVQRIMNSAAPIVF